MGSDSKGAVELEFVVAVKLRALDGGGLLRGNARKTTLDSPAR